MATEPVPTSVAAHADQSGTPGRDLWGRFAAQVDALADLVWSDSLAHDDLLQAEGMRYLLRYLAAGIEICIEYDDTVHPELGVLIENRRSWGLDNPDTNYGFCRLAPDASYLLTGEPGSARHVEVQVDSGHFADGRFAEWRALSRLTADEMVTDPDGMVRIHIATERPLEARNWMATGPDADFLHVRQYFSDWESERPWGWTIERVGAPYPPTALSPADMEARLDLLGQWLTSGAHCWADLGRGLASTPADRIHAFEAPLTATGLGGQAYGMGGYNCEPDEVVVLDFDPPTARYWSVSLATWFWESPDAANRQCSLNDHQAVVDVDGRVRMVISHDDPGVANWIDTGGHRRGTVAVRFLLADAAPEVRLRRMPRSDMTNALSADLGGAHTALVGPAERSEQLRSRRDALTRRYRR